MGAVIDLWCNMFDTQYNTLVSFFIFLYIVSVFLVTIVVIRVPMLPRKSLKMFDFPSFFMTWKYFKESFFSS